MEIATGHKCGDNNWGYIVRRKDRKERAQLSGRSGEAERKMKTYRYN